MHDADADVAAGFEDARDLADRPRHVVDVHERVVGDDQVEGAVLEREMGGVGQDVLAVGIGLAGGPQQRRGRVDPDHVVASRRKVAADPSLTAPYLEGRAAGRRDQLEERVAVDPVGIVSFGPRPRDPLIRDLLPVLVEGHRLPPIPCGAAARAES